MKSIVSLNILKKDFDMDTTHMVLVHDTVPAYRLGQMETELSSVSGVNKVLGVDNTLGPGVLFHAAAEHP